MTEILIYGVVGDEYDGLDAKTLVPLISGGSDDLAVRINSPGGFVMEGLAIFNAIARAKAGGRKVTTHIDGLAASMASVIAMAGDEVVMADNALMMIHNPWDVAIGDAAELRAAADKLDTIRDQLVRIYGGVTGIDAVDLIAMLDAETWLTSEQALEQKFVTSVVEASSAVACDVSAFGFRKAPKNPLVGSSMAAVRRSIEGGATNGISRAVAAILTPPKKEPAMTDVVTPAADGNQPADTITPADAQARIDQAVSAERTRVSTIRSLTTKHGLDAAFGDELVSNATSVEQAREKILDKLAEQGDAANIGHNSPARVTTDQREKFREGAANWLLVKAGVAPMVEAAAKLRGETVKVDPGEFRGVRNVDLAREALEMTGVRNVGRDPDAIIRDAMVGARGYQTISDFPVLFETALHKTLQAAYAVTTDTWSRFCGTGSVTDFRSVNRYLKGTFGALDNVNEHGEFKNKPIPDLAKEAIKAGTKGNIVALSRQAIVNDNEMEIFAGLVTDLGRAAKLTIEIDVYALLNANPNMNDGNPLFSVAHGNLAPSGGPPTVANFDAISAAMGAQKDVSNNEFLDIRPKVLLVPRGLRGAAIVANNAEFDQTQSTPRFQTPNIARGMFDDIVDTQRLTGTAYYAFADPMMAPAIEVVFLNGVTEPFTDSMNGWRIDGVEWKVRHDYGVGAINWRSAYKQPGS